jgi:hypothetical protein
MWEGIARILEETRTDFGMNNILHNLEPTKEGWFIGGKVILTKDPNTGEIASGYIAINLSIYNQISHEEKISTWIHEAAHVYFAENSSIGKGIGPWTPEIANYLHVYYSEVFAWERTFDYLSQPKIQDNLPHGSMISARSWLYTYKPKFVINYTIYNYYDDLYDLFGWPYPGDIK